MPNLLTYLYQQVPRPLQSNTGTHKHMANKKEKEAATGDAAETSEETAITRAPVSDIAALSDEGGDLQQVIQENFGGSGLTLADLDKIKLPSGGAVSWEIPTIMDDEPNTSKELVGVIIGWADKKAWWVKSFAESEGNEQPDCRSNDMVHGIGNPLAAFNDKERELMDAGKIGMPVRDSGGYLCATCPHNEFGSAAQGAGKSCQDKRFLIMLLQDSVIPVLVRAPATSIMPVKQYFKRLASAKKSYLSVLTSLSLVKIAGKQPYSQIVCKAVRSLTPEEIAQVRELRTPFQAALDADDAVEQANKEKPVATETLNDMPGQTAAPSPAADPAPATADVPEGQPATSEGQPADTPF